MSLDTTIRVWYNGPLRTGWANVIYKCNKDTDNYSMLIKDLQTTTTIISVTLSLYTQLPQ